MYLNQCIAYVGKIYENCLRLYIVKTIKKSKLVDLLLGAREKYAPEIINAVLEQNNWEHRVLEGFKQDCATMDLSVKEFADSNKIVFLQTLLQKEIVQNNV